jgi:hypothetical protein
MSNNVRTPGVTLANQAVVVHGSIVVEESEEVHESIKHNY